MTLSKLHLLLVLTTDLNFVKITIIKKPEISCFLKKGLSDYSEHKREQNPFVGCFRMWINPCLVFSWLFVAAGWCLWVWAIIKCRVCVCVHNEGACCTARQWDSVCDNNRAQWPRRRRDLFIDMFTVVFISFLWTWGKNGIKSALSIEVKMLLYFIKHYKEHPACTN